MLEETPLENVTKAEPEIRGIVRQAIQEFLQAEQQKAEPVLKAELDDERRRRESLETRMNQLVEENRKARAMADEADRNSQIRGELQRLGVAKLDLAFRAVKDDIVRASDGRLQARGAEGKSLQEYLTGFVQENPELLPTRIAGGSGAQAPARGSSQGNGAGVSMDSIKPGMSKEEHDKVRQEIARLASQALRGL
jgi:hypothetical protein